MEVSELLADLNTNVAVVQADVKAMLAANEKAHTHFAEAIKTHSEALMLLDQSIRGNGGAGLKERMNVLEQDKDARGRWKWTIIIATITAVAAATVTLVLTVITNVH